MIFIIEIQILEWNILENVHQVAAIVQSPKYPTLNRTEPNKLLYKEEKSRINNRFMEEENTSIIDVREIALKWSTKAEVYKVLTITGGVYLPPEQQVNSDFIRGILWGDKFVILMLHYVVYWDKSSENNKCSTHWRYENTWSFGICKGSLKNRFIHAWIWLWKISIKGMDLQCEYAISVIFLLVNSLIPELFKKFVNDRIIEWNGKIDKKRGNKFPILSTMAKIFKDTTLVSSN